MVAAGCSRRDGLIGQVDWSLSAVEAGPVLEEPDLVDRRPENDDEQQFWDEATGLPLDPARVAAARAEEWAYMDELEVMVPATLDEALEATGHRPVPCRWVDIDKGDSTAPLYRSRLVCQETRRRSTIDAQDWAQVFAATPPYEAFRLQLSLAMTGPRAATPKNENVLSF